MDFFEFLFTEFAACLNHQAKIIIVKRLIQERNNVTRVYVEPRSCDQGRRKNDAFPFSLAADLFITGPFVIRQWFYK